MSHDPSVLIRLGTDMFVDHCRIIFNCVLIIYLELGMFGFDNRPPAHTRRTTTRGWSLAPTTQPPTRSVVDRHLNRRRLRSTSHATERMGVVVPQTHSQYACLRLTSRNSSPNRRRRAVCLRDPQKTISRLEPATAWDLRLTACTTLKRTPEGRGGRFRPISLPRVTRALRWQ